MSTRRLFSILSILAIVAMLVSACGAPATQAPAATAAPAAAKAEATKAPAATAAPAAAKAPAGGVAVAPAGQFPIVKDKITMKVFMCPTNMIKDYTNNEFTKWLEAKTNIKLEFDIPPMAEMQAKLNLMLASDDLPEVIIGCNLRLDQMQILAEQGQLLPLNDYIAKYSDEYKNVYKTFPQVESLTTLLDGKIYGLPHINDCYHCSMSQKMWVYKPWLDKLGLKVPETTDEFEAMLKAFKTKDPNGNGKADEIPLSGTRYQNGGWHAPVDQFLMNSFVYNDNVTPNGTRSLILDSGKVKAAFTEPGWKEGVKYMNKLYAQGLIDPQAFTNDQNQLRQMGENPDVPIMGATGAGWYGVFTQNGGPSGRWKEYVPIPPLKGPSGMRQTPQTIYQPTGGQGAFVITKKAKNPEAAFRLADVFYGFDATTRSVFGPEGEDWVRGKPGEESIVPGGDPKYNVLKVWVGEDHNRHWNQSRADLPHQ